MLLRNLLYTGVTRGKRLVVLVRQRRALGIAVRGEQTRRRWSKLREWLDDSQKLGTRAIKLQLQHQAPNAGFLPAPAALDGQRT